MTEPAYNPAAGVITGVATCIVNAVAAVAALSVIPPFIAKATIVAVVVCAKGTVYTVEDPFGADPSVVYLIVANEVEVVIVTVTEPVYNPAAGVMTGVATVLAATAEILVRKPSSEP